MIKANTNKSEVQEFWNEASCGENLYLNSEDKAGYNLQSKKRYELEPYIVDFSNCKQAKGKTILEIGVGLGADHQGFAENGADLYGIDLTERAIQHVKSRFEICGLNSNLKISDAEDLDFSDDFFDQVYSWGVIHHSPNTSKAASEILRVLKPGGEFRVMVYHTYSLIGLMLWIRYGLLRGHLNICMEEIYSKFLESPGTKAYSIEEAKQLFNGASQVEASTVLTHADLLEGQAGQRHEGAILNVARKLWPRFLLKIIAKNFGLYLLIKGKK